MTSHRSESVGIDLDNTLVSYDGLFYRLGRARGVVPEGVAANKVSVHTYLHATYAIDVWTELQAEAYGPAMIEAEPFPGALEFIRAARADGIRVSIVSHRTRVPYRGPAHDLHHAARQWLARHGLENIEAYFEEDREAKCARIAALGCVAFIDDLPSVLSHPQFPAGVTRILFDPAGVHAGDVTADLRAQRWPEIAQHFGLGV